MLLQKNLEQYFAVVAELEKLLPVSASRQDWPIGNGNADTFLSSIKSAVQNVNDLLMHAASKINALTERMGAAKERHLERLRQVRFCPVHLNARTLSSLSSAVQTASNALSSIATTVVWISSYNRRDSSLLAFACN